jgi:hypothetical protein
VPRPRMSAAAASGLQLIRVCIRDRGYMRPE